MIGDLNIIDLSAFSIDLSAAYDHLSKENFHYRLF